MHSYLIIPLLQTVFCLLAIPVVALGRFRGHSRRLFIIYLLVLSLVGTMAWVMRASADAANALVWSKWLAATVPLQAALFCHFSLKYAVIRVKKWYVPALYTMGIILSSLIFSDLAVTGVEELSYGYKPIQGALFPLLAMVTAAVMVLAFYNLFTGARRAVSSREKTRDLYIFSALIFLFAGIMFDILGPLDTPLHAAAIVCQVTFFVLIVGAGLKYRLIEMHTLVRKGITHIIIALMVSLVYVLAMFFTRVVRIVL